MLIKIIYIDRKLYDILTIVNKIYTRSKFEYLIRQINKLNSFSDKNLK